MTAATHPAPARRSVGLGALWFGLFGAPVAWSIQELASYALIAHACYPSWQPRSGRMPAGAWPAAAGLSLVLVLLGLAAAVTAYRAWSRTRQDHPASEAHQLEVGEGRARFMAISGLIVSSIVLLNLVLNAIVLFLVPPCG